MTATRIYTSTATRTGRSTRTPTRVGTQGARSGSGCSMGSPAAPQFWSYSWQRRPLVPLSSYFAAFALGTMIGMLLVSFSLAGLVRLASGRGATWATALHLGSAVISVVVGLLLAGKTLQ